MGAIAGLGPAFGEAFIVTQLGDGGWGISTQLQPSESLTPAYGSSIALSGDLAFVADSNSTILIGGQYEQGAVYVFAQVDGGWQEQQTLRPNVSGHMAFGSAMALSGTTLLIAAPINDVGVFVFTQGPDAGWTQSALLNASDTTPNSQFGLSVAVSGGVALIGSIPAAYVFTQQPDGGWIQTAEIFNPNGPGPESFGWSVALENGVAVVGTPPADLVPDSGVNAGSVHVFGALADGGWALEQTITGNPNDFLGGSVALSGGVLVEASNIPFSSDAGAPAIIFEASDAGWVRAATGPLAKFAAISGDVVFLAMPCCETIAPNYPNGVLYVLTGLDCSAGTCPDAGPSTDAGPATDAGGSQDAGPLDAGSFDAGTASDAGKSGDGGVATDGGNGNGASNGCGCGSQTDGSLFALLAGLIGILAWLAAAPRRARSTRATTSV